MHSRTVCFSGHRIIADEKLTLVMQKLEIMIENLINDGYLYFLAGGALGFDTISALSVLKLKKKYPHIRLFLILPCISQADRWSSENRAIYEAVKADADKISYISIEYTNDCMYKRNRQLVENSSVCICYLKEKTGGTAYTVNYAKQRGHKIYNIAD